jgi:hypothetical protein
MTESDQSARLPLWARFIDGIAAVALLVAVWVLFTGGLHPVQLFGIRISISHPHRATFVALVLLGLRHWIEPRHPRLTPILRRFNGLSDLGERRLFGTWSSRSPLELLLVTLGFTLLVVALNWKQVSHPYTVSDLGDPLFSMWRVAWIAHQIVRDPLQLFNANIHYPEPRTLTYSDSILLQGLTAAPFIWLGVPLPVVYWCLFFASWIFSGVTAYYLLKALTGRRDAAAVGGAIFAVYPYRFEHYSHLEQVATVFVPLTLLMLHRVIAGGQWRHAIGMAVAYALQMYSCMYAALFLAVYMVPIGMGMWVARGRPAQVLKPIAAGGLLTVLLIYPLAMQYMANKPLFGERPLDQIAFYSAFGADYLDPHSRNWLYGSHNGPGHHPERELFPGLVSIALAVVGCWPPLSAARLVYALAGLLAFDASLGLNGYSYPWLHELISPYRGLRVPARFSILVGLSLAVLAAYGAARIFERWPLRRSALMVGILALAMVDVWPVLEIRPLWRSAPAVYSVIHERSPSVLADFPTGLSDRGEILGFRYMYFSTFHWQRIMDGASGFQPPSWYEYIEHTLDFPSDASIEYLRQRGVKYVAVHGAFFDTPDTFQKTQRLLAQRTDVERLSASRFSGSTSELYRLK